MSTFEPTNLNTLYFAAVVITTVLILGLAIIRLRLGAVARAAAWVLVIVSVITMELITDKQPPGFRMLAICATLFYAMKNVVGVESKFSESHRFRQANPNCRNQERVMLLGRWLAFVLGWPGMQPAIFAKWSQQSLVGGGILFWEGTRRFVFGIAMILGARFIASNWPYADETPVREITASWLAMFGLSLVIHFGVFDMLAGTWRLLGVDCRPLFRNPLRATTLTEFWGRRWNLAFSEMTALAIYRPVARHLGRKTASGAAFIFSGLVHELAISVPVNAGYGLPFLYFVLHGSLVFTEHFLNASNHPINRSRYLGRLWTLGWLALPLPMLFHPMFLHGVIYPIMGFTPSN